MPPNYHAELGPGLVDEMRACVGQGLTRRDIWALALAPDEPDVERMAALLQHLDDDWFPAPIGRVDRHDVAAGHGAP